MRGGKLLAEEPPAELTDFYQKDVKLHTLCFLTGAMVQSHIHATTATATFANSNILCSSFSLRVHMFYKL